MPETTETNCAIMRYTKSLTPSPTTAMNEARMRTFGDCTSPSIKNMIPRNRCSYRSRLVSLLLYSPVLITVITTVGMGLGNSHIVYRTISYFGSVRHG